MPYWSSRAHWLEDQERALYYNFNLQSNNQSSKIKYEELFIIDSNSEIAYQYFLNVHKWNILLEIWICCV